MIEIKTKCGIVVLIDSEDADLAQFKWCASSGYAKRSVKEGDKHYMVNMHRIILERKIGRPINPGCVVDHIDLNKANNTRANLREATHSQNLINQSHSRHAKNPYKGVTRSSKHRWLSQIRVDGMTYKLGIFDDPYEAHLAYCEAAKKYHGEFFRAA